MTHETYVRVARAEQLQELEDARSEAKYWRSVASYLAECHSDNGSIADMKSTSKCQRRRLVLIMRKALGWMRKERPIPGTSDLYNPEVASQELESSIRFLEERYPELK